MNAVPSMSPEQYAALHTHIQHPAPVQSREADK